MQDENKHLTLATVSRRERVFSAQAISHTAAVEEISKAATVKYSARNNDRNILLLWEHLPSPNPHLPSCLLRIKAPRDQIVARIDAGTHAPTQGTALHAAGR